MSILVDTVRIAGFRGIKKLEVSLPRVAVLIGQNNSGKTSFLKAMQLALGDYSRVIGEEDFHIGADGVSAQQILVDLRIVPVDSITGVKAKLFSTAWQAEFGDKIKAEATGHQFVAIRVQTKRNPLKGNFDTKRSTLERWPDFANWTTEKIKETNLTRRLDSLPFFAIEAQRDIHQELRDRTSFVGRVLSGIKYDSGDITALEELIKEVNDEAVSKSSELKSLKTNLEQLNKSFQGGGNAEITPFPKKIRDLSKHVSVHFGEDPASSFSMEYHGMGTRSWASLLTVKAFSELLEAQHVIDAKPFFPILAAEEPEAHLHPNAQKTIYRQLATSKGQVIVSTHSPYLAAISKNEDIRGLKRDGDNIKILKLPSLPAEDQRRLHREIIHSRGEILFSKAIVLCEGETEEQALPLLFGKYFESPPFELGINFVGVGGAGKYLPFFSFSSVFDIPCFVFSDGEPSIVANLKKHYDSIFGATDITTCPNITILSNQDFEAYLMSSGFTHIFESVIAELDGPTAIADWKSKRQGQLLRKDKTAATPCPECKQTIGKEIYRDYNAKGGHEMAIMEILDSSKPKYAPVVATKLCELDKTAFPPKIIELFEKIKTGLAL
jgi:putative ATP-dependent endonuclease of OLD family